MQFAFSHAGAVAYDAVIGDEAAQADHEMKMNDAGDEMGGDAGRGGSGSDGEVTAITVEPGEVR